MNLVEILLRTTNCTKEQIEAAIAASTPRVSCRLPGLRQIKQMLANKRQPDIAVVLANLTGEAYVTLPITEKLLQRLDEVKLDRCIAVLMYKGGATYADMLILSKIKGGHNYALSASANLQCLMDTQTLTEWAQAVVVPELAVREPFGKTETQAPAAGEEPPVNVGAATEPAGAPAPLDPVVEPPQHKEKKRTQRITKLSDLPTPEDVTPVPAASPDPAPASTAV